MMNSVLKMTKFVTESAFKNVKTTMQVEIARTQLADANVFSKNDDFLNIYWNSMISVLQMMNFVFKNDELSEDCQGLSPALSGAAPREAARVRAG